MVKVTFNSALAQKEAKKDEPKSSEEALIVPPDAVAVDCKDPGDVVPVGQRRAWCWCMCFGLAQKEAKKDEPKSSEEALIVPPDAVAVDCKDPGDVVPVGQRRAWCWCMCFGLAFMLAGVILGGAYLYKYFALQPDDVYYCGLKYIKDDVILNEPSADAPAARYQTIEENIKIFEEDAVEFISVPVQVFCSSAR